MSPLLLRIREMAASGHVRISTHGFEELLDDDISVADILRGLASAEVVEEYPDYHKGPCVLVLQRDSEGAPVHALWGTSKANPNEATLITAYRPDPARWSADFRRKPPK
jgi:hypothetical protein